MSFTHESSMRQYSSLGKAKEADYTAYYQTFIEPPRNSYSMWIIFASLSLHNTTPTTT